MTRWPALAIGLFLAVQSAFWIAWRARNPLVSVENGPMEVFQALALLTGFAVLAMQASRGKPAPNRVLLGSFSLFYLTFVFGAIDKLDWFPGSHHFYEELAETNAVVLMLLAAILTPRTVRDPGHGSPGNRHSIPSRHNPD